MTISKGQIFHQIKPIVVGEQKIDWMDSEFIVEDFNNEKVRLGNEIEFIIPISLLEECFMEDSEYKQYLTYGDTIKITNGKIFGEYSIEGIKLEDSTYGTIDIKAV